MRCILASLFAGVIVIPIAPALTSAHTSGPAGEGAAAISGYTISQVRYTPDASDPRKLASVSFAIDPAQARTVNVRLSAGDDWHSCSVASGQVDCQLSASEPTIASLTALDVIAS